MAVLFALLLAQADDPTVVAEQLDAAIRKIAGFNAATETKPVGDDVFLRRLTRDLVDAAPSDAEVQAFAADADSQKRMKAVDRLLADDRFGAAWARRFTSDYFGDPAKIRFSDLPGLPAGTELRAVKEFEGWLAGRLNKDLPWTEIVTQIVDSRGTTAGDPAMAYKLSFYRGKEMPLEFAQGLARDFLGVRLYCARCHDHPFDKWTPETLHGLGAFVVRQKVRVVDGAVELKYADEGEMFFRRGGPRDKTLKFYKEDEISPQFLYGGKPDKFDDRMKLLGFYLSQKTTTQLPRALANRVWGRLLGVGIVNPIDDFSMPNKPVSPALLEALVRDTIDHHYSLKRLVRVISATRAYQQPTPEEQAEAMSFRHLVRSQLAWGRYMLPTTERPPPPLAFDVPAGWTRMKEAFGAKALFVAAGKQDPRLMAELAIFDGKQGKWFLEGGSGQFIDPKKTSDSFAGKGKVTLVEISGGCTCVRGADGPTDYTSISALLEFPSGTVAVRLAGPASVVRERRDEFLSILKSAVPR